jgi:hypothetical protein
MAGLPMSGRITLADIRSQIGVSETDFSLDTAENGVYATINPCSQYKPASENPTSLSEWYGYNHRALCNSYEYTATISDIGTSGSCEQVFDYTEARLNISMIPFSVIKIGTDPQINRLQIRNIEKFPSVRVEVKGNIANVVTLIYAFEGNGASYVPWDLIPNTGSYGAGDIKSLYTYTITIWYGDGSGRVLSNQRIYLTNPPADGYYVTPTYYSSAAGTVCGVGTLSNYVTFAYPFTVGASVIYQNSDLGTLPDGYYRMLQDPNVIYRVVNQQIYSITSC